MAVTQISKIQIRRGFQADIGNLAAGEFAWAVDTQRLFIGNGTTDEGAPIEGITEIMTNAVSTDVNEIIANYVYKGALGGYIVVTGTDTTSPVIRALQDKIDDFVNVRDFGAAGTGNIDDTAAIQRALYELYDRYSRDITVKTRRKLRFNAGEYLINGDLKIPPYVSIEGEGINNVILRTADTVRFIVSTGFSASEILTNTTYPTGINIKGLTIACTGNVSVMRIDGTTDTVFEDVGFIGPITAPDNTDDNSRGVWISSTASPTDRVTFNRCVFKNLDIAAQIDSVTGTTNISFQNCEFSNLSKGIVTAFSTEPDVSPADIKITASKFENIYSTAIYGDEKITGIVSLGNRFKNCASFNEGDTEANNPWEPIIAFNANGNYSIADTFNRNWLISKQYPRIVADGYRYVSFSLDEYMALGSAKYIAGNKVTLPQGQGFSFRLENSINKGIVNYTMLRENQSRVGVIKYTRANENIYYDDEYVQTEDLGVTLNIVINPLNSAELRFTGNTDDRNSSDVTFCYDVKTLS